MLSLGLIALTLGHVLGALSSVHALLATRTEQGAIAWIVSLNTIPLVAVPAYWVFGRSRFHGYVIHRRRLAEDTSREMHTLRESALRFHTAASEPRVGERLVTLPYLEGNRVDLLVNGEATFASIFEGIDAATASVLVQFYIVHDDGLGRALKGRLIAKARAGLNVRFLYDEMGSAGLPRQYLADLRSAGVHVSSFHSTRGAGNRFQLNFRNHRKIVVVDGKVGWVGGHNVGDEYLGKDPHIGPWRDTHIRIEGPAVLGLMISFAEDWRWATDEVLPPTLWSPPEAARGPSTVAILPTGPADRLETASLMYQHAIGSARRRVWVASPYFVPDQAVMGALQVAALRGVDVRILIPDHPDSRLSYYAPYAFVGELLSSGIRVYRHLPGFLHEKVFLVDDDAAGVGTANFDNRSFRLNFEVTGLVIDAAFVREVEAMFLTDFAASREMSAAEMTKLGFWFRVAARASYLLAPLQ